MVNTKEINKLMVDRNINQTQLAAAVGCAQSTLSQKISGSRSMDLATAEKIQAALDIPDEKFCFYFCFRVA